MQNFLQLYKNSVNILKIQLILQYLLREHLSQQLVKMEWIQADPEMLQCLRKASQFLAETRQYPSLVLYMRVEMNTILDIRNWNQKTGEAEGEHWATNKWRRK